MAGVFLFINERKILINMKTISHLDLNNYLEEEIKTAFKFFENNLIVNFLPKLIVSGTQKNTPTNVICEIAGRFENANDKYLALYTLGKQISKQQIMPEYIALVSEAWMTPIAKINPFNLIERKEVILISIMSTDKKSCLAIIDILRKGSDKHITLGNIERIQSNPNPNTIKIHNDLLEQFYFGYSSEILKN